MSFRKIGRRRSFQEEMLNLTPIIDIVFNLLLFFMVTTSFSEIKSGINIKLPNSNVVEVTEKKEVVISIDEQKNIYLNSSKVDISELQTKTSELINSSGVKTVVIRADRANEYGYIVKVMTIAKNAGAEQLDIATEKEE